MFVLLENNLTYVPHWIQMGRKPQSIVRYLCVFVDFERLRVTKMEERGMLD